jgi:cytochrome P450
MPRSTDPETGKRVLSAFLRERSLLPPLQIMYERMGRFFQIPLPGFHPFVVGGPVANRKVLVTERHKVRWGNSDPVSEVLRRGVLVTDGAEHDLYRSLMEPALSHTRLEDYAAMMVRQADRVSATWRDGDVLDMLVEGRKIALLIIMEALFGVDFWSDMPRLWTPILKTIAYISPGPWILWRRLPRPGFRRYRRLVDGFLFGIIGRRRAAGPRPDLLGHLLEAGLDDERIRDQMLTMLIAGHDTSTALLAWTFHLLGTHPAVMAQLEAELEASLGDRPPPGPGGWQPRLLDDVVKEALRLYPPIHMGNRVAAEAIDFADGDVIPAGERFFYSIYLTQRDKAVWEEADDFRPERFARGRKTPPLAYVPFGGGPRSCIGSAFGLVEARIVIARLLQCFRLEPTGRRVSVHMGATLEPRPGVFMRTWRKVATGPAGLPS